MGGEPSWVPEACTGGKDVHPAGGGVWLEEAGAQSPEGWGPGKNSAAQK